MPILSPNSMEIISRSPEQTRRVGMRLGALLKPGDVLGLTGDLGSGKTTLVQGIASGWGSQDHANSPTFVIVNVYRRADGCNLYHLDAYRLSSVAEAEDLDLETLIESGPLVIEWAERIKPVLPEECIWVTLTYVDEKQRDITFSSHGSRCNNLLSVFRKQVFGG